jgi:hypothetical protein
MLSPLTYPTVPTASVGLSRGLLDVGRTTTPVPALNHASVLAAACHLSDSYPGTTRNVWLATVHRKSQNEEPKINHRRIILPQGTTPNMILFAGLVFYDAVSTVGFIYILMRLFIYSNLVKWGAG